MEFRGSLDELKALVARTGQTGRWVHEGDFEMFVVEDGVSNLRLNWWPGNGTVMVVGDPAQRRGFTESLNQELARLS